MSDEFSTLDLCIIALPIFAAAVSTIHASLKLVQKYVIGYAAAYKIESECFRYWTRTGAYRNTNDQSTERFVRAVAHIYRDGFPLPGEPRHYWEDEHNDSSSSCEEQSRRLFMGKDTGKVLTSVPYYHLRVQDVLKSDKKHFGPMINYGIVVQVVVILMTAVIAVLGGFQLFYVIPALVNFISFLEFMSGQFQFDERSPQIAKAHQELKVLSMFWNSLSDIEKIAPENVDRLVDVTETTLLVMHEAFARFAQEHAEKQLERSGNHA